MLYRNPFFFKLVLNLYPPYWATGIRVAEVSPDFRRVVVQMRRHWYNGNSNGVHFGGSLYSMCDPFYALMLIAIFGKGYRIVDYSATIAYLKPGKGTVQAVFEWSEAEIAAIRLATQDGDKHLVTRPVTIHDEAGDIVAELEKTIYIRKKQSR